MAGEEILLRDLREARESEAAYRARLARHRDLSRRLRAHAGSLQSALRTLTLGHRGIERLLIDVAQRSSQALGIPRASIWLFDEAGTALVCRCELPASDGRSGGLRIATASCPGYIAALSASESGAIAIDDVWRDPRASELGDYLRANNVGAMLDIPILGPGVLRGVVCHEYQGGPRVWQEEEIEFARDIGAMVALALEAERRISAERAARATAAKYQSLVESLPVAVYSFETRTGELDYLSPRIRELGGRPPEEYLVSGGIKHWLDAIEPEDQEPVAQRLSGKLPDGNPEELVYRIHLPDGALRWVRDTCAVVRDAHGRPLAVQGTLADVTAFEEAKRSRAEVERRHRELLEHLDLLALVLGATGRVEFVNDCFIQVTGFSREEAIGADGFDLILPEPERERTRADFLKSMRKGKIVPRFESTVRTRTGAHRRILWTNTSMRDSTGAVIGSSSLGVDITNRLTAEASQLERQKLESLGRLAATVAHDFNNLLTIISGATTAFDASPSSRHRSAAREIEQAVGQATGLTRSPAGVRPP